VVVVVTVVPHLLLLLLPLLLLLLLLWAMSRMVPPVDVMPLSLLQPRVVVLPRSTPAPPPHPRLLWPPHPQQL
jgi:hypothetical protein